MSNSRLDECLEFVLHSEGGYVNHPDDPGGETIAGIARKYNPTWEGWEIVDLLTSSGLPVSPDNMKLKPLIKKAYLRRYWEPSHADLVQPPIDLLMFDAAVQHGVKASVRMFQRAAKLRDDGVVGPKTRWALREHRGQEFLTEMLAQRVRWYLDSVARRGNKYSMKRATVFNLGWGRRIAKLANTVMR